MKRSGLLQVQLGLNAQVLCGLYEEYNNLRKSRKMYNAIADELIKKTFYVDLSECGPLEEESKAHREQAAIFTPYINKFAKRIKAIEQVQKELKYELKFQQAMESWNAEEDAFWLKQARIAAEEGFVEPTVVDKFIADLEDF